MGWYYVQDCNDGHIWGPFNTREEAEEKSDSLNDCRVLKLDPGGF